MEKKKAKLLFKWLANEKAILRKVYTLALLQGIMYIAIPIGIQGVVTYIMAGSFSASLILLCSITIVATMFVGFFQIWQMRINETLHQKIFGNLTTRISSFLNNTSNSEDILFKLNKYFEVVTLQKGISKILLDFSFSLISIFFGVLLLPLYSPWFMFFTIIIGFSFYFIIVYYGKKGIETNVKTSNEKYNLIEWFQKKATSNDTKNERFVEHTDFILNDYIINRKSHFSVLEKQFKGIILFKVIFVGILLFFGAFLVQRGDLNIGQFVASEIIIFLVINSVEKLVSSLSTCYDIITALHKIEKVFGEKEEFSFLNTDVVELEGVSNIYKRSYSKAIKYSLSAFFITGFIILFMPWTQSVESKGKVTTLNPEGRPQTITSRIAGRVENWFISEGDFVKKNDTIAFISEIKDEYMDPLLISRSEQQIKAKEITLESYEKKVNAVNFQIDALNKNLLLKMEQTRNKLLQAKIKVRTDSIEAQTSNNNYKVAEEQLQRFEELLVKGVISKTDLENRRIKVQDALAKKTSAENKFMSTKNELLNAEIELNSVQQDYQEKIMKAESEKFSALSSLYEGEGSLTKLQGQLANYSMRKGYYYVLAPQDGYITKAYVLGIGEIVKEGAALCSIVPKQAEQAVELYINPIDLPLIQKGQNVQLTFDGWPAFVFSGWPGISFGTYQSEIVAFDKAISDNGKFRILVKNKGERWPDAIQIGSGVEGFALLNNVPVIYEIWRKLNGFPPEFYVKNIEEKKDNKQDGKSKFELLVIVFVFLFFNDFAQTTVVLSYDSYLKNVLENNPISKRADNIKQYGELQYKASKGNFDPFVGGTYQNKHFNGSNYYSIINSGVKVPLFTAQNLKIGYEYGVGQNVNPEQYTSSYGLPYVGLEVGLLQGMFIDYRRADLLKSKEYVNYYSAEKNIQLNNLLYESSLQYFDWLFSLKQLALNNYFMELAKLRLVGIESLANIGERAAMDTVEAAILYQSRLLDFQSAKIEIQKQNNELAMFNWQTNAPSANELYKPADSLDLYFEKAKNGIIKQLYQDSTANPVIDKYNSFQKVLAIDARLKKEMIKPKLNVNYNLLSYNVNSFSPVYTPNNYKWGVDLSFPLFLRKSRNEYKMAKVSFQSNLYELANKTNELDFKLNTLKQTIAILSEQLQNAERSVRYNKQLVEAEKLKFNNGESSLFILNARENKWLESELKFAEYKFKFIKTIISIVHLKGTLNYLF